LLTIVDDMTVHLMREEESNHMKRRTRKTDGRSRHPLGLLVSPTQELRSDTILVLLVPMRASRHDHPSNGIDQAWIRSCQQWLRQAAIIMLAPHTIMICIFDAVFVVWAFGLSPMNRAIEPEILRKLARSMPTRCQRVIEAKRWHTKN